MYPPALPPATGNGYTGEMDEEPTMTAVAQTPPPAKRLLTAAEYGVLDDGGRRTELVRGEVIDVPPPKKRHGIVCSKVGFQLQLYLMTRPLGQVASNDTGVQTGYAPDTVRGADVCFFSYERLPPGPIPDGYETVPELVFEVRSPSDRTRGTVKKVQEYHAAGVLVVCLVDPDAGSVEVHPVNQPPRRYTRDEAVELPELFPDFNVPVRALLD